MPVPEEYLASIQPAMASYQNASYQPAVLPSLESPGPMASVQPAVTMPDALAGGASVQPPPADTQLMSPEPGFEPKAADIPLAGGTSAQPPAPPPPAAGPAQGGAPPSLNSGVTMIRGGTTPAHEVATVGPKALQHLENAKEEEIRASNKVADLQQTAATNQILAAQVAKDDASAQIAGMQAAQLQEQQQRADAARRVQQAGAGLDKPITDYWSDKSTGSKIALTIAAALGQLGAGIAGKGGANPVMGIINSAIENDARTKQLNYQRGLAKKDAAQQDYNNVVQQIGLGPTNDRYIAAMKQKAGAEAAMQAAQSKIPEVQANAIKFQADQNAQAEEYLGKAATKLVQAQKVAPQFTLPGNPIPVSGQAAFGALEKRGEQAAEQQNKLDVAGMARQGKTDEGTKFVAEQMQHAKIPERLAAINKAAQSMTPTAANPNAREGIGPVADYVKKVGGAWGYSKYYGENAGKREQDWEQVTAAIKNSITGAGMSDKERERLDAMLEGAKSPEARANSIDTIRRELQNQMDTIGAGAGPDAYARYQQNLQQVAPQRIDETPVKK